MILPETYVENKISERFNSKFTNSSSQSNNQYKFQNQNNNSSNPKQVYYEVGCKIFEMNKIYK